LGCRSDRGYDSFQTETEIVDHHHRGTDLCHSAFRPRGVVALDRYCLRNHHRTCLGSHVRRERCSALLEMRRLFLSIHQRDGQTGCRNRGCGPFRHPGIENLSLEDRRGKLVWAETWNDLAVPWGS
jgi:hypothetical protein